MAIIDIFNGDADGICALTQLRNDCPADSVLVTGVKRDIQLVDKANIKACDKVTILDISMDKNSAAVRRALDVGAEVFYVDHHFAGDIPENQKLRTIIDTAPDVCTSILVNSYLRGKYLAWAVVGAYGDNLKKIAEVLGKPLNLSAEQYAQLENLGIYINYNGYGAVEEDLHFSPSQLYQYVSVFSDPLEFIAQRKEVFTKLEDGYLSDMQKAKTVDATHASGSSAVFLLPNAAWSRRVSGVYGNNLANMSPARAHAVITERAQGGGYVVGVRAPLENTTGADDLCRRFPTGGGRKAAAGINELPASMLDDFIKQFSDFFAT